MLSQEIPYGKSHLMALLQSFRDGLQEWSASMNASHNGMFQHIA
jgi:hypothetical protein